MSNPPEPDEARHAALYDALRAKLHALYERNQFEIHEAVLTFHDYLKKKYTDARDRRLFHLISGSTLKDFYGELDFPKPDSVEDFINAQYHAAFTLKEPHEE
jgi:hypothetical protein